MNRTRLSLDGTWDFAHDASAQLPYTALDQWRSIQTPMAWQAQFDDLRWASGAGWYRRSVAVNTAVTGAAILHIGAADYLTTVWLNGQLIGEHEGGYLPFEFDVTQALHQGDNELLVRVVDPDQDAKRWPESPFAEIPHGKQSWYGPISGLWQSVWLEMRSRTHIQRLRLTPDVANSAIAVSVGLTGSGANYQLRLRVSDPSGATVAEAAWNGRSDGDVQLAPGSVQLWSPDTPALYTVSATLLVDGQVVDELADRCGFRTVEARDGRIYLNGQPIYLRGVLDQAYYPETIYTPPSLEFLEDQARKAKALGLNCLRTHIKVEDPRYYEVADRFGLLIWTEIPNWAHLTENASRRGKEVFAVMVERDWNHPSIIAWTLINENWGTDLTRNPEHRRWLADFYHEAKAIDPTRLIIDNSACHGNSHVAGDLEDYHHYRAIPDHAQEWDDWVADFASRASDWVWYGDYQHERRADLPLILSEFGNWGLPDPAQLQEKGAEPWWFETGYNWGEGIVYPHAMPRRFSDLHLERIFGDLPSFARAHQEHMARSLAYEITTMRLQPSVAGYIITEFTDVHWECNGLMDMQRNIKHGLAELFTPLNQDRVVTLRPQRWSGRPGERVAVDLRAFGVDGASTEGVICWHAAGQQGEIAAPGGAIEIALPEQGSQMVQIGATWLAANGAVIAHNQVEMACVAPPAPAQRVQVRGDAALAAALRSLGYDVTEDGELGERLVIARHYDAALQTAVQSGVKALIIARPEFAATNGNLHLPMGEVVARAGTAWQGDWATSFSWLKKQGPFAHLPGGALLAMDYAGLTPDAVLVGLPHWVFAEHSWAGLALGWIHKVVSLLTRVPYGRGAVTATTFKLEPETLISNVVAQGLLAGLVELAAEN